MLIRLAIPKNATLSSKSRIEVKRSRIIFCGLTALAYISLLPACSKSVVINTDFPEPLITALPLSVGLHYGEALRNYSYREDLPNDGTWSFSLGEANTRLFDGIFESLFEQTIHVDNTGAPDAQNSTLDAIIEPTIEALEFSLPRQSRSDQYAVWIRYNLDIYKPDGNLITRWTISAYGQSDSKMLGAEKTMAQATINAMRDAGASIITGFEKEPVIKEALLKEGGDEL
jgi:hypothetical protein